MTLDMKYLSGWVGHEVHSTNGEDLGGLIRIYTDGPNDEPRWLEIKRGTMTTHTVVVPLRYGDAGEGGFTLPFSAAVLDGAPPVTDSHRITSDEQRALDGYYAKAADAAA
jgi:hypothetical protein